MAVEYFVLKSKENTVYPVTSGNDNVVLTEALINDGYIRQPIDFSLLKYIAEETIVHGNMIGLKNTLISGLGFDIINYSKLKRNTKKFLDNPTGDYSILLRDIIDEFVLNYIVYGNADFELVRIHDKLRFYTISPINIFPKAERIGDQFVYGGISGYAQIINGTKKATYEPAKRDIEDAIHYIYRVKAQRFSNSYYGIAEYVNVLKAILINMLIAETDYRYFDNGASPDLLIVVTGGKLDSKNKIKEELQDKVKGYKNAHKTAVLSTSNKDAKVDVIPINSKELDKFTNKFNSYNEYIASAHKLSLKTANVNKSFGGTDIVASIKRDFITVINPQQRKLNAHISRALSIITGEPIEFVFKSPDLADPKSMAVIHSLYITNGIMTRQEVRNKVKEFDIGIIDSEMPNELKDFELSDKGNLNADKNGRAIGTTTTDNHDYQSDNLNELKR